MNELRDEIERVLLQITPEDLKKAKDDEIARGGEKGVSLNSRAAIYSLDRQLKSSLAANRAVEESLSQLNTQLTSTEAANREQKEEIERLTEQLNAASSACEEGSEIVGELASVGEKWVEISQETPPTGKLPEYGVDVLLFVLSTPPFWQSSRVVMGWLSAVRWNQYGVGEEVRPTHWMPLPVAPTLPGEEK